MLDGTGWRHPAGQPGRTGLHELSPKTARAPRSPAMARRETWVFLVLAVTAGPGFKQTLARAVRHRGALDQPTLARQLETEVNLARCAHSERARPRTCAAPTSSPSALHARGQNNSCAVATCATDAVFMAVPPSIFAGSPRMLPTANERGGGTAAYEVLRATGQPPAVRAPGQELVDVRVVHNHRLVDCVAVQFIRELSSLSWGRPLSRSR